MSGLTLTFSNVYDIGDMVEVNGQIGRVEHIGLRFTTLVNLYHQRISIPNRVIGVVAKYRRGSVRAYVDIDVPPGGDDPQIRSIVARVAAGMHAQFPAMLLTEPEIFGVFPAGPDGWRFLRLRFRLWPGQSSLVETTFKQRLLAEIRRHHPDYSEWMVAITWRVA